MKNEAQRSDVESDNTRFVSQVQRVGPSPLRDDKSSRPPPASIPPFELAELVEPVEGTARKAFVGKGYVVGAFGAASLLAVITLAPSWTARLPWLTRASLAPAADLTLQKGEEAVREGNFELARGYFDQVASLNHDFDLRRRLGEAHLATAVAEISWLRTRATADRTGSPISTEALLELASRAREAARNVLAVSPRNVVAISSEANALQLLGHLSLARELLRTVPPGQVTPEVSYVDAAIDFTDEQVPREQVIEKLRAISNVPEIEDRVRPLLAYTYMAVSDFDNAERELRRLNVLARKHPLAPELESLLRTKRATSPAAPQAAPPPAVSQSAVPRPESAPAPQPPAAPKPAAPQPVAEAPRPPQRNTAAEARSYVHRGAIALQKGDFEEGNRLFRKALAIAPGDAEAMAGLERTMRGRPPAPAPAPVAMAPRADMQRPPPRMPGR